MSTEVEVQDPEALNEALANIRSDSDVTNRRSWVLVGHVDGNPSVIDIVAVDNSAEATIDDFRDKLADDQTMYGLIRLATTYDMSTTVKFVYVHWCGADIPPVKRGKYGVVHGSVQSKFGQYHVGVETGDSEDLTEEELIKQLEDSSGTRSHVVSSTEGRQERGFTQFQTKSRGNATARTVAPQGVEVEVSPELQEAIGNLRSDSSDISWVLATFENGNIKSPLTLAGTGSGDIEEFKECLQDDQVMYGLYRTKDVLDGIKTIKFVYIYWIGDEVKPMTKGKVSSVTGTVERCFGQAHFSLTFNNRYDIDEAAIMDKVTAGSGSKSFEVKG